MAKLLYEDLSTWQSNLKKTAISTAPSMYNLTSHLKYLLKLALPGLRILDDLGRINNAAHPALHTAAITFFYTGSYHITHRKPDIFKEKLPLHSLALYNYVFDGCYELLHSDENEDRAYKERSKYDQELQLKTIKNRD
ncbi:hypothetical protein BDR07DRAFT_1378404 [Suillus spraguei]|nr:hypothetical protein BDR07DRAFT_1378404 [Suillus spraguei]